MRLFWFQIEFKPEKSSLWKEPNLQASAWVPCADGNIGKDLGDDQTLNCLMFMKTLLIFSRIVTNSCSRHDEYAKVTICTAL